MLSCNGPRLVNSHGVVLIITYYIFTAVKGVKINILTNYSIILYVVDFEFSDWLFLSALIGCLGSFG